MCMCICVMNVCSVYMWCGYDLYVCVGVMHTCARTCRECPEVCEDVTFSGESEDSAEEHLSRISQGGRDRLAGHVP